MWVTTSVDTGPSAVPIVAIGCSLLGLVVVFSFFFAVMAKRLPWLAQRLFADPEALQRAALRGAPAAGPGEQG